MLAGTTLPDPLTFRTPGSSLSLGKINARIQPILASSSLLLDSSNLTHSLKTPRNSRQALTIPGKSSIETHPHAALDHIASVRTPIKSARESPRVDIIRVRFGLSFSRAEQSSFFEISALFSSCSFDVAFAAGRNDVPDEARVAQHAVGVAHGVCAGFAGEGGAHCV